MEYIRRNILLENSTSRDGDVNYGELTATTFNIPLFLTQQFDDIGLYTDMEYLATPPLVNPPNFYIEGFRPTGVTADMYYGPSVTITGTTDDLNLLEVKGYNELNPYVPGLNQATNKYIRYDGVISYNQATQTVVYVIGGDSDVNGDYIAGTGVVYTTYLNDWVNPGLDENGQPVKPYQRTTFSFVSDGRTALNTSLSALTKEEEFLGVVFPQEIQSEVFIERGAEDIFEKHMVLAEIKTVNEIDNYRGGYLVNINV
jgi:hypothetical protein